MFFALYWQKVPLAHALTLQAVAGESAHRNTLTYTNADFDFSLSYPSDLSIQEYDEGGGTKTIVFQKPDELVGFQMFITPDDGDDPLTPADIELDFPTLEMENTERVAVGTGESAAKGLRALHAAHSRPARTDGLRGRD